MLSVMIFNANSNANASNNVSADGSADSKEPVLTII